VRDREWQTRAACGEGDLEIFYSGEADDTRAAIAVCRSCPVRRACFEAAVARGEHFGVWGGTTERERRRIIRARNAQDSSAA
jgi:WhiB family transcriptional regulator, redox-sensing transcriptional regulator